MAKSVDSMSENGLVDTSKLSDLDDKLVGTGKL